MPNRLIFRCVLSILLVLLGCGADVVATDDGDELTGARPSQPKGSATAVCPVERPLHTVGIDCPQQGLVCEYQREDGCPMTYRCGDQGAPWWSWSVEPTDGTACDHVGECFYPEWECGGTNVTAACIDGAWVNRRDTPECTI